MVKLPKEFKNKYTHLLGQEESERLFSALNLPERKAYRINQLKIDTNISYDQSKPIPNLTASYYGEIDGTDPEWVGGSVYSQDPSAMFPATLANIQPGEKVLDLCAAPGGKTTKLGESLAGKGLLVANEISATRVKALRENLERWGIDNAVVTNNDSFALAKVFPEFFDTILVDAPCSGEGMFRKSEDAVNYWSQDYVMTCQARQKEILQEAMKMLKPGGKLVYSTCTFSPEEDEQIVAWLVAKYNLQIQKLPLENTTGISYGHPEWTEQKLSDLQNTLRFWPQNNLGEGQFLAVLKDQRKQEDTVLVSPKKQQRKRNNVGKGKLSKEEIDYVSKVIKKFNLPEQLSSWKTLALNSNDHIFIPALDPKRLKGLKIINNGLELGIMKKRRFEPGHQLAAVLSNLPQTETVELIDKKQYDSYLHGETLQISNKLNGFVLVSFQQKIFSFGKMTGNKQLKNFYPKGLRK